MAPGDMSGAANTRALEGAVDRFAALAMTDPCARVFAAERSQGGGARRAPGDMNGAASTRALEGSVDRFAALAMTG
jgi:hypothetical protein